MLIFSPKSLFLAFKNEIESLLELLLQPCNHYNLSNKSTVVETSVERSTGTAPADYKKKECINCSCPAWAASEFDSELLFDCKNGKGYLKFLTDSNMLKQAK